LKETEIEKLKPGEGRIDGILRARLEIILLNTIKLDKKYAKFQKEYYEMRKALSEQYAELLKKNPVKKI